MGRAVLIAAASGRALAASARRGGYAPLVADFFGDEDTAAVAEANIRLGHGLARGMSSGLVIAALERLASPRQPAGIVCGTGFEDRPELLADIAQRSGQPVELWDERLTTARALRAVRAMGGSTRGRKDDVDALAATLLLQHYLDAKRGSAV